ncbi:MAG: NAD(P)H-quinone oxidoreductase [Alphaproteobacteria bacterium]|nr:NAD(P)H-quinone oxidoreductase [Alphaproteobacteria bacterium]
MKAIEIKDKALRPTERPLPEPGNSEVLIRVHAAGVNRPDILQRLGHYPPPAGVTDIPGLEVAGEIVRSGERVCALVPGGGYAEYAIARSELCLPVPPGFSDVEAAALPEAFFTVWKNLFVLGGLKKGETTLIHGGASGIGTTAIQLAKAFGARVITTAGSPDKCEACRKLGADLSVNYREEGFATRALEFTGGRGVDVVLDMVGGDYLTRNTHCMAFGGRHVSIAFQRGMLAEINILDVMRKNLTLVGSTLRDRPVSEKNALARELKDKVWPLLESRKIAPVVFRTFPLEEAEKAHAALDAGEHIGKIVLTTGL